MVSSSNHTPPMQHQRVVKHAQHPIRYRNVHKVMVARNDRRRGGFTIPKWQLE